jgi:hypothetical protein
MQCNAVRLTGAGEKKEEGIRAAASRGDPSVRGKEGWDGKDHHVGSAFCILDAVSLSKNSACVDVVSWE